MKKYIFTENQIKVLVECLVTDHQTITEQNEDLKHIGAIQKFLNHKGAMGAIIIPKPMEPKYNPKYEKRLKVDGALGKRTQEAIKQYQKSINAFEDGFWGPDTEKNMPKADKELLNAIRGKF